MSRLGTTAVTFLLLGAADAVVTYRLEARHGRHVTRWASDTAWSEATGDETWHLWPARGRDGAPRVVVVHGSKSLAVWTLDGQAARERDHPLGDRTSPSPISTATGRRRSRWPRRTCPPAAPVSIQVFDQSMNAVTPNVGLLESLENPASVAIVPVRGTAAGRWPPTSAAAWPRWWAPDLAWEYCFPDSKVGGDPYAVRHLFPVTAGGGLLVAGRATGEVDGIDAAGKRAWSFRLGEPLRRRCAVARLDGGAELAFAGGEHGRYALLDAATGQARGSGTLPGMVMVARPAAWEGQPVIAAAGSPSLPSGSHSGFVAVVDGQGRKLAVTPVDGQVMDLAAADFDGDGTDELVAVTGSLSPARAAPVGSDPPGGEDRVAVRHEAGRRP